MTSLFRLFAERHLLAYMITLVFIILGIASLISIKIDSFPDLQFGAVLISTTYPGVLPEDVELIVTKRN